MISFAAIIFKDELFTPWLGQLAKLAFLGSSVHQLVFTIVSTLPFAVGQVRLAYPGTTMLAYPITHCILAVTMPPAFMQ